MGAGGRCAPQQGCLSATRLQPLASTGRLADDCAEFVDQAVGGNQELIRKKGCHH